MEYKIYTEKELEKFCEEEFIEGGELTGFSELVTNHQVKLETNIDSFEEGGELIIRVKLTPE